MRPSYYWHQFLTGYYEVVDCIDQNPRPEGYEGTWMENEISTYHWVGRHSGLLAIQQKIPFGPSQWLRPDGTPREEFICHRGYEEDLPYYEEGGVYGTVM